eukprot:TRINITY_DN5091_c0_g1_i1.p1 TRINITY_DN5091_c0_g1~~TRINITY_DN5091_c0_g1_i1.p1  ORF type:complete len:129 (-),score=17.57 TRINITY_DN5091_c0_g1_i1:222-608(-)
MPFPKSSAAIGVSGTQIVVAGGFSGTEHTDTVLMYDHATRAWSELPDMGVSRTGARGSVVANMFYAVGGWFSPDTVSTKPGLPNDLDVPRKGYYHASMSALDLETHTWEIFPCDLRRSDGMVLNVTEE